MTSAINPYDVFFRHDFSPVIFLAYLLLAIAGALSAVRIFWNSKKVKTITMPSAAMPISHILR